MSALRYRGLWWLSPAGAVAFVVFPTLLLAGSIPDATFREAWRTPKLLTSSTVLVLLIAAGIFCITSTLPLLKGPRRSASTPWPRFSPSVRTGLIRASGTLFWLTMVGYVSFGLAGLSRGVTPADLVRAFVDQDNLAGDLKAQFAPIPGITTLSQVGIAYVTVATALLTQSYSRTVFRRLLIVIGLALFRSFIVTERLALLELLVPIGVVIAMRWAGDPRSWLRRIVNLLPVLLVPMLVAVFGAFEYSRSWVFFQARSSGTFLDFAVQRLSGYYVTAYNNGQVALLYDDLPRRLPMATLDALWTAPVVDQLGVYDRLSPGSRDQLYNMLKQVANPEFNNYGGLSAPFVDWGLPGGMIWWALAGLVLGVAYRSFANGSTTAILIYPPLATGVYEIPRYVYWAQGRLVPALVALLLTALYVSPAGQRARRRLYRRLQPVS